MLCLPGAQAGANGGQTLKRFARDDGDVLLLIKALASWGAHLEALTKHGGST
jgi:hypothetical protein